MARPPGAVVPRSGQRTPQLGRGLRPVPGAIDDLYAHGGEFARLWDGPIHAPDGLDRLRVPDGDAQVDFDKDVLTLTPGDLRIVVFTRSG